MEALWRRGVRAFVALLLAAGFFAAAGAEAAQYYVKGGSPVGADGKSWATAFSDTEFAGKLKAAKAGDVFWVASGDYFPSPEDGSFILKNGVKLYGGFAGTETSLSERDWMIHPTFLSGDLGLGRSPVVVKAENCGASTVLDGFIVTGGDGPSGGGMRISGGAPTVENCFFKENKAVKGAGLYVEDASPVVRGCIFRENRNWPDTSASVYGGGLYIENGSPRVTNCSFEKNVLEGGAAFGGGLYCSGGRPLVVGCTFEANAIVGQALPGEGGRSHGAGLYVSGDAPVVVNCTFSGNNNRSGLGGAIASEGGSGLFVLNCTMTGNSSSPVYPSTDYADAIYTPLAVSGGSSTVSCGIGTIGSSSASSLAW